MITFLILVALAAFGGYLLYSLNCAETPELVVTEQYSAPEAVPEPLKVVPAKKPRAKPAVVVEAKVSAKKAPIKKPAAKKVVKKSKPVKAQ